MMNIGLKKCVIVWNLYVLQERIWHFSVVMNVIGKQDGKIVLTEITRLTGPWFVIKKEPWLLQQKTHVEESAILLRNGPGYGGTGAVSLRVMPANRKMH